MLTIRKEQFKAFEVVNPAIFIPVMIKRLAVKFPSLSQIAGEEGLTKIIEEGMIKCKKYGIENAYQTGVFIELSILLGNSFDSDPMLDWPGKILNNLGLNPEEKIKSLASEAVEFMNVTLKDELIYPVPQFNKIINTAYNDLALVFDQASPSEIKQFLQKFWPEKFNLLDADVPDKLFTLHNEEAVGYGFESSETKNYYILLMFLLGHRFDIDPQYPWISDLLNDSQFDEEFYKASSLHFTLQQLLTDLLREVQEINKTN